MSTQISSVARAEAPTARVALRCEGLVKRFADVTAVDGLDLEVFTGECFGLLGPNGAGKTTTVEILEGLTPSNAGTVELLGQHWTNGDDRALRERIGVQLQETQLAEKVTVAETVRLFRSFYQRGHNVDEVIRTVALEEKRNARVGKLSGGQKQRLAAPAPPRGRRHDSPDDALHGRGDASLRSRRDHGPRKSDRTRHAGRVDRIARRRSDHRVQCHTGACRRSIAAASRCQSSAQTRRGLRTDSLRDCRCSARAARRNKTTALRTRHTHHAPGDTRRRVRQFDRENAPRWMKQNKLSFTKQKTGAAATSLSRFIRWLS